MLLENIFKSFVLLTESNNDKVNDTGTPAVVNDVIAIVDRNRLKRPLKTTRAGGSGKTNELSTKIFTKPTVALLGTNEKKHDAPRIA